MLGRLLTFCLGVALCHLAGPARADNCRYLEMQLMQLQGSSSRQAEAGHVRAMLRDRGCTGQRPSPSAGGGSFRFDFNSSRERPRRDRDWFGRELRQIVREPSRRSRSDDRSREDRGTYRTLCVRSCDGYYFPISFSTTRQHLAEDEATCRQLCPAGGAELYYHSVRSEGPEQMRSMGGDAYSDLENAFRYREVLDQSCTCGTPTAPISLPGDAFTVASIEPASSRLPRSRPAPGADPETMLNRLGDLSFDAGRRVEAAASVRVVLPAWYTTESAVLLSAVPN